MRMMFVRDFLIYAAKANDNEDTLTPLIFYQLLFSFRGV